jgi:hypothetical protein
MAVKKCEPCNGSGQIGDKTCYKCGGKGIYSTRSREYHPSLLLMLSTEHRHDGPPFVFRCQELTDVVFRTPLPS